VCDTPLVIDHDEPQPQNHDDDDDGGADLNSQSPPALLPFSAPLLG